MKKKLLILFLGLLFFGTKKAVCQDSYYGELRLFPYNFVPEGWLECNGQTINVSQYTALFSVIGNTFGGNGVSTFCVPNLNGRVPIGTGTTNGTTITIGQSGGTATETMTESQLPAHTHTALTTAMPASSSSGTSSSLGYYAVNTARGNEFNSTTNSSSATMSATVAASGGTAARNNMQPYLVMLWCICSDGFFPSRN